MADSEPPSHSVLSKPETSWLGRYRNPFPDWKFPSILYCIWLWIKNLFQRRPTMPSKTELERLLPVQTPVFPQDDEDDEIRATWLGHAAVLFYVDGARVLCDPIFSEYCSPVQGFGSKRYRPAPCAVSDLPQLDAVVISHTHFDHLDTQSVKDINRRFPEVEWFVPMGCAGWMRSVGCENVEEMTWWDEKCLGHKPNTKVVFTPTQHWSGRSACDANKCLWGSWAVIGPKHRVWFAGDTGYCRAFKEIGDMYGPFDISAIPIGAYCPRWFMHPQHVDPQQAVEVHLDVKSKLSLAIHWGTFVMMLAVEEIMQPVQDLKEAIESPGMKERMGSTEFVVAGHGQTLVWDSKTSQRRYE